MGVWSPLNPCQKLVRTLWALVIELVHKRVQERPLIPGQFGCRLPKWVWFPCDVSMFRMRKLIKYCPTGLVSAIRCSIFSPIHELLDEYESRIELRASGNGFRSSLTLYPEYQIQISDSQSLLGHPLSLWPQVASLRSVWTGPYLG